MGMPELLIILVIIFIIFGAGKLPEIGTALGKGIQSFKKATRTPDEIEAPPAEKKSNTSEK
jgi:sec-independent protein translocase protein TatA